MALRLLLPLLLLAATLLITQAQGIGSSASDCCLKNSRKAIPSTWVKSYRLQGPESGCLLHAVVLTTKRNKKICASPADPEVQKLMQHLDKKAKNDKGQSPRPRSRPRRQNSVALKWKAEHCKAILGIVPGAREPSGESNCNRAFRSWQVSGRVAEWLVQPEESL
ncbi:PREDICTED: C-C motif chemokine 21 [Apaloderma vittatum]|uniref:C-C motif chemokine 21 n=1 Tax=Apaloderma vittatum TaxID=57397 RepID=UPI00052149E8|nr:PREDICTED: C-C motif chemokine 21 [Apaloderma vittatum]